MSVRDYAMGFLAAAHDAQNPLFGPEAVKEAAKASLTEANLNNSWVHGYFKSAALL